MAELNAAWTAASEEIYKAQAEQGTSGQGTSDQGAGAQANAGSQAGGETVTDAEFEEVK